MRAFGKSIAYKIFSELKGFSLRKFSGLILTVLVLILVITSSAQAGTTTWIGTNTSDWNDALNWTGGVPNSSSYTALFDNSSTSTANLNSDVQLNGISFIGSTSYVINTTGHNLSLEVSGISDTSSADQFLFNLNGSIDFFSSATASDVYIINLGTATLSFHETSSAGFAKLFTAFGSSLSFNDSATAGNSYIDNVNGSTVSFNDTSTAGYSAIGNSGIMNFNDDSTAGNAAFYTNGNLNFFDNASAGSASIWNDSKMTFNDTSTAGSLSVLNNSSIVFHDTASAASMGCINDGNIFFDDNSVAGNTWISNNNYILFDDSSSAGMATLLNGSSIQFSANSTANNATIINNLSIAFDGSSTAGNASITNNNDLEFSSNSTAGNATITTNSGGFVYFYGDSTGGTARLAADGTGFVDFSDNNASAITVGSIEGSGTYYLGGKNLVTGANDLDTSLSGVITDGGDGGGTGASLTKIGTGTFTLAGTNTYTGDTTVLAGTLAVDNASALGAGDMIVNGGTLTTSQGPLAVNVGGDYTQTASGKLRLNFCGSTANEWDSLTIGGTASLDGVLQLSSCDNFHIHGDHSYLLLSSAGPLTGAFGTLTNNIYADTLVLVYGTNNVVLLATGPTFASVGNTSNQQGIGASVDSVQNNAGKAALVDYLSTLSDPDLRKAYEQMSPSNLTPMFKVGFANAELQSAVVGSHLSNMFGGSRFSRLSAWNGNGTMFAGKMPASQEAAMVKGSDDGRWNVFADGTGNFGAVTADNNGSGYKFSAGGMTTGVDYRFDRDLVGGLLFGYGQSGTSESTGVVNVSGGQFGLYAGVKHDDLHVEAILNGGIDSYNTKRTGLGGDAAGSTQGTQYMAMMNLGYNMKMSQVTVGPFVRGQFTQINVDGFTETGSLAPLTYANQSERYVNSHLGTEASLSCKLGDLKFSPSVSAAWEHVYQGAADSLTANLGAASDFTVAGSVTGTDAAVLGGGVSAEIDRDMNAHVEYQGKIGMTNYTSSGFSGGMNLSF